MFKAKDILRGFLSVATFVLAAAFFWGTGEALLNRRWPPQGTWWPDDLLTSAYGRVIFYAVVVAVISVAVFGFRTLNLRKRGRRGNGHQGWRAPVAAAAVVAANAGWFVVGATGGYQLNLGVFGIDFQNAAWFFGYYAFWAAVGAALAVTFRLVSGRWRGVRVAGRALAVAGAAGFVAVIGAYRLREATRPVPRGPNVVLIVLDAWRADAFRADLMPHVSAYAAKNALVFERSWSCASLTLPALGTIFTGQYFDVHRQRQGRDADKWSPTIAQRLRAAGYDTVALSANRILDRNAAVADGFDQFYFVDNGAFARTVHFYDTNWYGPAVRDLIHETPSSKDTRKLTKMLAALIEKPRRRPYFLWVHYMDPHGPYKPPAGYYRPEDKKFIDDYRPWDKRLRAVYHRLYEGECRFVDDQLGPLLPRLAAAPRTVVVITADHGEEFWDHAGYTYGHGKSVYDTGTRVPLIIRLPGAAPARVTTPVGSIDLAPTLLTIAGYDVLRTAQGRPFLSPAGRVVDDGRPIFIGSSLFSASRDTKRPKNAVISWPYKLILDRGNPHGRGEYYNLAADPGETNPLPEDENARRLRKELRAWGHGVKTRRRPDDDDSGAAPVDLKALGYIR